MYNIPIEYDGVSTLPAEQFNSMIDELKNIITSSDQVLSPTDNTQLAKGIANYVSNGNFYTDSGIADAYVLNVVGAKNAPTAYANGFSARFIVGHSNTGASTVNIASLGIKNITKAGVALSAGELVAGNTAEIVYNLGGDYFDLAFTTFDGTHYVKDNVTSNITVGYTYTEHAIGNSGTGTITPLIANAPIQTLTVTGSFTLAAPSDTHSGVIEIKATNNVTGGYSINTSAYTIIENNYDNTANKVNIFRILKVGSTSYLSINPVPKVASGTGVGGDNVIINGGMDIVQRKATATPFTTVTDGTYTLDRWRYNKATTTATQSIQQSSDVPTPDNTVPLLNYSMLITNTATDGSQDAGDLITISQRVEGSRFAQLAQRSMTLSFWVKSTITGTYCVALRNSGNDRSYVAEYTINSPSTWERKVINILASPTAGTWNYTTGVGIDVNFTLMGGSTYQTTAGAWQTGNFVATSSQTNFLANAAATFQIDAVNLESGMNATSFINKGFSEILKDCRRYYEKSYNYEITPATAISYVDGTPTIASGAIVFTANNIAGTVISYSNTFFKTSKRTAPTLGLYRTQDGASLWARLVSDHTKMAVNIAGSANREYVWITSIVLYTTLNPDQYEFYYTADAEL